ncbi:hypothetical protein [Streptomyces sp. NPDC056190]|uniref:hypothetical protein n=1 Tax=unclassified Streptomyces TaxID=2593676 RepID=UPI0035DF9537
MWPARAHPERSPLPPGQPSEAPVRHSSQTSPHQHNTEESTAWQPPPATPASPARPTVAALRSLAASPRPVRTSSTSSPGRSGPRRSSTANGKVVFDAPEVEVPEFWSQVATDVWASSSPRPRVGAAAAQGPGDQESPDSPMWSKPRSSGVNS